MGPPPSAWLGATLLLLVAGFARSAIPGVNEPHYWTKARHFWQPHWLDRDLFLTSANAHAGFYAVVGWLAAWFPLPLAVVLGRVAAAAVLAFGFGTLARGWGLHRAGWPGALAVWLLLSAPVGLSGEWVIGGVESKVFAWGLLLAGYGVAWQSRFGLAAALLGAATTLHPLVGGWGTLVLAAVAVCEWLLNARAAADASTDRPAPPRGSTLASDRLAQKRTDSTTATSVTKQSDIAEPTGPPETDEGATPGLHHRWRGLWDWWWPVGLFALTAAPGLLPVLGMLLRVPSPEIARQSTEIQVYERLAHHLLPDRFTRSQVWVTGLLWGVALTGGWSGLRGRPRRLWLELWLAISALAACGWLVNHFDWRAGLLRFYPFRLIDGFAPVAAALGIALVWQRWSSQASDDSPRPRSPLPGSDANPTPDPTRLTWIGRGMVAACLLATALWPFPDRVWPRWRPENRAAWLDVCAWIDRETPANSLWLTPRYSFGFKWWARRAEWAVWKDCPQDAASLVEWKRRLDLVAAWRTRHHDAGFNAQAVRELTDATGLDFVLAWNDDPYEISPIYRNAAFSVYRLRAAGDTPDGPAPR